jgi:hypothetical protein
MPGELSNTRALGPFKKETIGKPAMEAFVAGEPATLAGVASGGVDGFRYDPSWMSMRRVGGRAEDSSSLRWRVDRFRRPEIVAETGLAPTSPRVWRVSICSMSSR